MNIRISNLPPETTEEELRELFSRFGKVKSVKIVQTPPVLSKGYGFIDKPASPEIIDLNKEKNKYKISLSNNPQSDN